MMIEFSVWYILSTQHMTKKKKLRGRRESPEVDIVFLAIFPDSTVKTYHLSWSGSFWWPLTFSLAVITWGFYCCWLLHDWFASSGQVVSPAIVLWSSVLYNPLLWLCLPTSENSINSWSYVWYTERELFNMLIWLCLPLNFLFHMSLVLWV